MYWCNEKYKQPRSGLDYSFPAMMIVDTNPEITENLTEGITNCQLDISLRKFTEEELNAVLKKIKSRKAASFDKIPSEVWKTRKFDNILLLFMQLGL